MCPSTFPVRNFLFGNFELFLSNHFISFQCCQYITNLVFFLLNIFKAEPKLKISFSSALKSLFVYFPKSKLFAAFTFYNTLTYQILVCYLYVWPNTILPQVYTSNLPLYKERDNRYSPFSISQNLWSRKHAQRKMQINLQLKDRLTPAC